MPGKCSTMEYFSAPPLVLIIDEKKDSCKNRIIRWKASIFIYMHFNSLIYPYKRHLGVNKIVLNWNCDDGYVTP
jgi:hypothetical protein